MRVWTYALAIAVCMLAPSGEARGQEGKAATKPESKSEATKTAVAATVNLNTATVEQLESLPGIGRSTAQRIVEHRQKTGGFKKIEELMNVKGIGEKAFLKLTPFIIVSPKPDKSTGGQP
jgi:competence protein ComEA